MKKIFLILLFLSFYTPLMADNSFFKVGGGISFDYFSAYQQKQGYYNWTQVEEIPQGVASLAVGVNCPDNFSFFMSGEWLPNDLGILANVRCALSFSTTVKPYLFFGIGLDMTNSGLPPGFNNHFGLASQLGLGNDFPLSKDLDIFAEAKLYFSGNFWSDNNYIWLDVYSPCEIGLIFRL